MIQVIRVISKEEKDDLRGAHLLGQFGKNNLLKIRTARVYRIEGADKKTAKYLADKLFSEKINQEYTINDQIFNGKSKKIEIAYKPGVMNPEVGSILKSAKDLKTKILAVDSSTEYYFFGNASSGEIEEFVNSQRLFNPLIEYIVEEEPKTLLIQGKVGPTNIVPIRNYSDDDLMNLSKDKLFLNLDEMKVIQNYFTKIKRDPTDVELETLAQTWSEHCAHKTFKANLTIDGKKKLPLIDRIRKEALKHPKNIVSAFSDNSGVMKFYDGYSICGKVETHNSPSAIEPYGGAMTGSGGVFRDVLGTGQGAKTIASTDIFCFANPNLPVKELPPGCLPPDYLFRRVVYGVRDYGNRMGIPTNNGSVHFHNDFRAKPTVIVGAYGIIPTKKAKKGSPQNGDLVIAVGSRTGRDGVHGATFSSGEMTDKTISVNSSAVQIGNAIEEKRTFDAIIEARDKDLIRAMTDCGAGGFSSAIGEMGSKTGVKVDLSLAPLKYHGLSPWEIWVSESQERMVLAVSRKHSKKLLEICKKYNVEATVLGKFTNTKKLEVYFGKKRVANLSMEFLHDGLPQRTMIGKTVAFKSDNKVPKTPKSEKEWNDTFKKILSHGNVNSKEPIVRMYDHSVQGTNDLQPYSGENMDAPNDSVVLRPLLNKKYGMVLSHGINPILNRIDPYKGSIWAGVEGLANFVSVGGNLDDASLINNYIWPFPDEESLASLDKSVDAVVDLMKSLKIPVISGKDSLSSTYRKGDLLIKIPPVLCISVFGRIPDATKTISSDFKKENSVVCLVGDMDIDSMGGSVYFDVNNLVGNDVPKIDLRKFGKVAKIINREIINGNILSCHDVSEGGVFTSIFEMSVGGNMGVSIKLPKNKREDYFLFNETAGAFVVEIENRKIAEKIFKNVSYKILGKTKKEKNIEISLTNKKIIADLVDLKRTWQKPMKEMFA